MKDLLFLLAGYPFEDRNKQRLSGMLTDVTSWDLLIKLLNEHGIIALAAYNIREAGLNSIVPGPALALLQNGLMKSIARNTWLAEKWKVINHLLNEYSIRHVLLKGMALEHSIYGAMGLRQMNDIDIMIKPGESQIAWRLLEKSGFKPDPLKSPLFKKITTPPGHHLPAMYQDGLSIEIHDRIYGEEADDGFYESLHENSQEIMILSEKAYVLRTEDHLKYLKWHYNRHYNLGECQVRLLNDIILLGGGNESEFPDRFLYEPFQSHKLEYRKRAFRNIVKSLHGNSRFYFIIGDIYPSLQWMRRRYKCGNINAMLRYPARTLKLLWLFKQITN